jgi:hypothetical protein
MKNRATRSMTLVPPLNCQDVSRYQARHPERHEPDDVVAWWFERAPFWQIEMLVYGAVVACAAVFAAWIVL